MGLKQGLLVCRKSLESGWCQKTEARDSLGKPVNPNDPNAVCWCFMGSLHTLSPEDTQTVLVKAAGVLGVDYVTKWNDDPRRTKEDVLKLMDNLIKEFD